MINSLLWLLAGASTSILFYFFFIPWVQNYYIAYKLRRMMRRLKKKDLSEDVKELIQSIEKEIKELMNQR